MPEPEPPEGRETRRVEPTRRARHLRTNRTAGLGESAALAFLLFFIVAVALLALGLGWLR
jgi:hypothetical protein